MSTSHDGRRPKIGVSQAPWGITKILKLKFEKFEYNYVLAANAGMVLM